MNAAAATRVDALILAGPTGIGKTDLALGLAERFPVEIISMDSAQVYRGMDIGTAKPPPAVRARVPHHLLDLCDPAERYSAGRFRRDAIRTIEEIRERGNIPLIVGGTMLYFRALSRGIAPLPEADPALRTDIDERARRHGWPSLHAELALRDPAAADRIRPNDGQRIQRALEVLAITGQTISSLQSQIQPAPCAFASFTLTTDDRAGLYARTDARFLAMMAAGFLEEVAALRARGDLDPDLPSLRAVGYRQLWAHLEGRCSLAVAVADGQRATRNLVKRQSTWIRSEAGLTPIGSLEDQSLAPILVALERAAGTD